MARIRTIKPQFFRHRRLYLAEQETGFPLRVAFAGLWTVADRDGRFKWEPDELKLDCLPYDKGNFADVLDALEKHKFIVRYTVGGETFGYIPTWSKHQIVNRREAKSGIPDPPSVNGECQLGMDSTSACTGITGARTGNSRAGTGNAQDEAGEGTAKEQRGREGKGKEQEGKGKEREGETPRLENLVSQGLPANGSGLAALFVSVNQGKPVYPSDHAAIVRQIDEMIRVGMATVEGVEAEILREGRDRGEMWWQLKKRFEVKGNAQRTGPVGPGRVGPSQTDLESLARRQAKTPDVSRAAGGVLAPDSS